MYQNFRFENYEFGIMGYLWDVENPKKVMCIIHGIGEHMGRYDRMAGYLTEAGIAVLGIDLRGHGLSEGRRGHTTPRSEVLDDISMMLEKAESLYPGVPIVLYGHSMGGNICLDYRARGSKNELPVKYIVSAPWLRLTIPVPKPMFVGVKGISKAIPKFHISTGCKAEDLGNLELTANYSTDPLVHVNITIATAVDCVGFANALLEGRNENNGRAIDKPFLLMQGGDDKICDPRGARALAAKLGDNPNFKYIEWPGYYHEIHNGGPEVMGEEVIMTIRNYVIE